MKKFIKHLKESLSKSDIYSKPEHNKASKALGYIVILVLILSLVKAIIFGFIFFPTLSELRIVAIDAIHSFPSHLILTLKNGSLSMNQAGPYILPMGKKDERASEYKNFIVIDTTKTLDFKTLESYDTAVLITSDGYMTLDTKGMIKAQTFKSFPDYVLSKEILTPYTAKINSLFGNFSWLITLGFIMCAWIGISIGTYIGVLFFSLLGVLVTFIVTRIKKHTLSFSQLFALSVYAYTIVLLFDSVNYILHWPAWVGFLLFVGLTLFVEKKA